MLWLSVIGTAMFLWKYWRALKLSWQNVWKLLWKQVCIKFLLFMLVYLLMHALFNHQPFKPLSKCYNSSGLSRSIVVLMYCLTSGGIVVRRGFIWNKKNALFNNLCKLFKLSSFGLYYILPLTAHRNVSQF